MLMLIKRQQRYVNQRRCLFHGTDFCRLRNKRQRTQRKQLMEQLQETGPQTLALMPMPLKRLQRYASDSTSCVGFK